MAWTAFETPNARYVLLLSVHRIQIEKSPEKFDALVLEQGISAPQELIGDKYSKDIVEQAIEQGKQIWVTDAKPTKRVLWRYKASVFFGGFSLGTAAILLREAGKEKTSRRAFIKRVVGVGILSPFLTHVAGSLLQIHKKEIKHHVAWNAETKIDKLIVGRGAITPRDLITAEKCESFLAPKLWQELGRKPTIAMVWGAAHYGIRDLLLHPEKRQRLLQKYDLTKFVKADYPKSFRIHLKQDGTVDRVEEFPETLRIKKQLQKQTKLPKPETLSRRTFLAQMLGRRKRL